MLNDPRDAKDPFVQCALALWDTANTKRESAYADATKLRDELRLTGNHQAFGWATATCGRIAAYRGEIDAAEALLTEALGRFMLVNDVYGRMIVTSHLAIPQTLRGNLARCIELALEPFQSGVSFNPRDLALLHNVAALCHHEREEFHAALFQLNSEYSILKRYGDTERLPGLVSNIGVLLIHVGEFELALASVSKAWNLEKARCNDENELQLIYLSHIICANCQLDRIDTAGEHADELMRYLKKRKDVEVPCYVFDNLAEVFARLGQVGLARQFFRRAQLQSVGNQTPRIRGMLVSTEAQLAEATGNYRQAIDLAQQAIGSPDTRIPDVVRRAAASIIGRCYAKLGDQKTAKYWVQYRKDVGRENLLSDILSEQIRTNFRIADPKVKLTEQELNCLRLSANGQTSSDIGLKLGIKPRTVNFHFSKILRKLNAMNRQEAIAKAANANLLNLR